MKYAWLCIGGTVWDDRKEEHEQPLGVQRMIAAETYTAIEQEMAAAISAIGGFVQHTDDLCPGTRNTSGAILSPRHNLSSETMRASSLAWQVFPCTVDGVNLFWENDY